MASWIQDASDVSNVVVGIAAVVSLYVSARALREVTQDRHERVRPKLLFDTGGQGVVCTTTEGPGIPGVNPGFVRLATGGRKIKQAAPANDWAALRNVGSGAALHSEAWFLTEKVETAQDEFSLDAGRLTQFPYDPAFSCLPAFPSHVKPGEGASLSRIPAPVLDLDGRRSGISGLVALRCRDIYGDEHWTYQDFYSWYDNYGDDDKLAVVTTFGDEVSEGDARKRLGPALDRVSELTSA